VELQIEKLVYGGEGLARTPEGEVIFVPFSAPGDHLQVDRIPGKSKPPKAAVRSILTASQERTTPVCADFETCGGCQWQHLTLNAQRAWKRNIVAESLTRLGKLPDVQVLETIGSDEPHWLHRNRVQWEIDMAGDELSAQPVYKLGYYQAQSHDVVEFSQCHSIPDSLNQLAMQLRALIQQDSALASGLLRAEAFISPNQEILLTLESEKKPTLKALADQLLEAVPTLKGVCRLEPNQKDAMPKHLAGDSVLTFELVGKSYQVTAGSFFQTNYAGAEALLNTIDSVLPAQMDSLLDVYAGVGLFSVHFAKRAMRVMAIESSHSAEADAQENFYLNEITNVHWKNSDARLAVRNLNEKFEVAIVDPPRAGCQSEVLSWLSENIEKQLVYVSCNPTTLARDLKTLVANGWTVDTVQPIDMFPQTYHVETVVSLSR
jgi:23S rRNA (uracil1939-C5)-methyltransferase